MNYFSVRCDTRYIPSLIKVSRLIKNMIPMPPHALTPEHTREAQSLRDLVFIDTLIIALRLTNLEFPKLDSRTLARHTHKQEHHT
jgi:hypothetical protein